MSSAQSPRKKQLLEKEIEYKQKSLKAYKEYKEYINPTDDELICVLEAKKLKKEEEFKKCHWFQSWSKGNLSNEISNLRSQIEVLKSLEERERELDELNQQLRDIPGHGWRHYLESLDNKMSAAQSPVSRKKQLLEKEIEYKQKSLKANTEYVSPTKDENICVLEAKKLKKEEELKKCNWIQYWSKRKLSNEISNLQSRIEELKSLEEREREIDELVQQLRDISGHGWGQYPGSLDNKIVVEYRKKFNTLLPELSPKVPSINILMIGETGLGKSSFWRTCATALSNSGYIKDIYRVCTKEGTEDSATKQGYTFFVDTPGIGSSEKATQKFMDYLADADSFVFEINVQHGVGVQIDRFQEIPNSIVYRKLNKRVPWFDPQNVIFVPNKWDTIKCNAMGSDENSSDEAQFDKLRTALESMIKKNEEWRVIRHFRFLEDLPTNVSKGLNAEPQLTLIIEKDQQEMEKAAHKEKINKSFYKSFELKPKVLNQSLQLSEETSAEATSNNLLPAPNFSHQDRKYSDAQFRPFLRYFYYQPAKHFPHFDYFYSLTRKCKLRFERMKNTKGQSKPMSNVVIRIGIAGWFNDNNLKLISKRKGKEKMPEDAHLWPVSPLLCFQNESSSKSAIEVLRKNSACHKILIKSDEIYDDIKEVDDTIITIGQNKEQIKKSITKCLEEPLHSMLEEWLEYLKNYGSIRIASRLISEIETIREQMAFDESRMAAVASGLPMCAKAIVPEDVKNYLFGRNDVNSFGIWSNSSLKIFVQKMTNVTQLREELLRINRMFFEKYHLEIEERKLIEKRTLRQGDSILPNLPDENGTYNAGTLGGFVTKTDDERKIYALTCNHLFLDKNEANLAYADNSYGFREIGTCVFSTTDKSCDFAAIEIMDSFSDNCEVIFRREDEKKTNARLHTESLHPRIVHKIGAATNVTTGIICSPEWYKKILNDENREYIFLVEGIDEQFSEEGDSGALVFSRPKSMQQNYVDVLGMVYANDLIVYDDEDDQKSEGVEKKEVDSVEKPKLNILPVSHNDENEAAENIQEGKNISCCYRLYTALELFQENQGEDFTVKFKDDLSSSSRSSSPSSKSDDSNQEPLE